MVEPEKKVEEKVLIEMTKAEALEMMDIIENSQIMEEYIKINDVLRKGDKMAQFYDILSKKTQKRE